MLPDCSSAMGLQVYLARIRASVKVHLRHDLLAPTCDQMLGGSLKPVMIGTIQSSVYIGAPQLHGAAKTPAKKPTKHDRLVKSASGCAGQNKRLATNV